MGNVGIFGNSNSANNKSQGKSFKILVRGISGVYFTGKLVSTESDWLNSSFSFSTNGVVSLVDSLVGCSYIFTVKTPPKYPRDFTCSLNSSSSSYAYAVTLGFYK